VYIAHYSACTFFVHFPSYRGYEKKIEMAKKMYIFFMFSRYRPERLERNIIMAVANLFILVLIRVQVCCTEFCKANRLKPIVYSTCG